MPSLCHNYGMSVRTTIDIPDQLYSTLRQRSAREKVSIRSLVIMSIEEKFQPKRRRVPVTGPIIKGKGKPGPLCPTTENPYDLIFD
jgi:hypothetical protein